jgi:hypothetical protein
LDFYDKTKPLHKMNHKDLFLDGGSILVNLEVFTVDDYTLMTVAIQKTNILYGTENTASDILKTICLKNCIAYVKQ